MLLIAARSILVAVAVYFLILGSASLIWPDSARRFFLGFATTASRHYAELAARFVVGGSLLVVSPHNPFHATLAAFGWILSGTTVIMALVPWRLHCRFAEAAVPRAMRYLKLIGISSIFLGVSLLWALFAKSATWRTVQAGSAAQVWNSLL